MMKKMKKKTEVSKYGLGKVSLVGAAVALCCVGYSYAETAPAPFVAKQRIACCHPITFACTELSATCTGNCVCNIACLGWQGCGNRCLGIGACYLPGGGCIEIDEQCCDDAGGIAGGGSCTPTVSCCMADGSCDDVPVADCIAGGGSPGSTGSECGGVQSCCDGSGSCTDADAVCCSGTAGGAGSSCGGLRPCCNGGSCEYIDEACCAGTPGWADMDCGHSDADGVPDGCDTCPLTNDVKQLDSDGDGWGDACDFCDEADPPSETYARPDADVDGIPDFCDNCDECPNFAQLDADTDGIGDYCDNCPYSPNTNQHDCDGDGCGDICDDDIDNDGVPNEFDVCDYTPPFQFAPYVGVITQPGHPLRGTVYADVDGDCDVDETDQFWIEYYMSTESSCASGVQSEACGFGGPGQTPTSTDITRCDPSIASCNE